MEEPGRLPPGWRERLALRVVGCLAATSAQADGIREILRAIRDETGVQRGAIRLQDGDDFPCYASEGFSERFLGAEASLLVRGGEGTAVSEAGEAGQRPPLACLCGRVLRHDAEGHLQLFTPGGSFFTPDLRNADITSACTANLPPRSDCVEEGLATIALVPLRHGAETIGLLHLGDSRVGLLTADDVAFLEQLGGSVGVVLAHRRAQEQLRMTEDTYRRLFDELAWGYALHEVIVDGQGAPIDYVTVDINRAYERILRFSRDKVVGRRASTIMSSDELAMWLSIFGAVALGGQPSTYQAYSRHNDRHFRGHAYLTKPGFFAVAFEDITDRIRAESALQESEERFRTLADSLPQTVFEAAPDGRLTYANRNAFDVFGYSPEEFEAGVNALSMIAPGDRARALETIRRVMAGAPSFGNEYLGLRRDETEFPIVVYSSPIVRGEDVVGLRGIIVDISEQKLAEQERERLVAQVHHAQKMESVGTLAGGVAHDFNNLLAGILGGLSLLDDQLGGDSPCHADLEQMQALVMRGAELTKQLLGFARRGKFNASALDINDLVQSTAKWFGRTRKDIVVLLDCSPGIPAVVADQTQLEQVLLNLLLNAGQAMPGGGQITLQTTQVELSGRDAAQQGVAAGSYVRFSVVDTGSGMDAATRERIFEPFFTTKEPGQGTGLGLASVYGIVQNHGGFVTVESEPGDGAAFHVFLPATAQPVVASQQAVVDSHGAGETILLVDDEVPVVAACGRMLEAAGYKVLTALGGRAATEILHREKERVALVILDMIMPGVSGAETFDELRRIAPNVKVLLMSGYGEEGAATELLERGCSGFLQKPFNGRTLASKVKQLL